MCARLKAQKAFKYGPRLPSRHVNIILMTSYVYNIVSILWFKCGLLCMLIFCLTVGVYECIINSWNSMNYTSQNRIYHREHLQHLWNEVDETVYFLPRQFWWLDTVHYSSQVPQAKENFPNWLQKLHRLLHCPSASLLTSSSWPCVFLKGLMTAVSAELSPFFNSMLQRSFKNIYVCLYVL